MHPKLNFVNMLALWIIRVVFRGNPRDNI